MSDGKTISSLCLQLERFAHGNSRTLGLLSGGGIIASTQELPWRENHPSLSCLPLGRYDVVRHPEHQERWVVLTQSQFLIQTLYISNGNTCGKQGIALSKFGFPSLDADTVDVTILTEEILDDLTNGIDRWRLEINYVQPYARYVANYGYHKPQERFENDD